MKRALLAALIAAVGNSLLYVVCYASGIIPWNMLSPGRGVSITPRLVILVSIGGALLGAVLFELIKRITVNPVRTFRITALVLLIVSFSAPLSMEAFTLPLTIALDLMHVVVYAAVVWALTIWGQPQSIRANA